MTARNDAHEPNMQMAQVGSERTPMFTIPVGYKYQDMGDEWGIGMPGV